MYMYIHTYNYMQWSLAHWNLDRLAPLSVRPISVLRF